MNSLDEFSVRATGSSAERLEALYRTGSAEGENRRLVPTRVFCHTLGKRLSHVLQSSGW